MSNGRHPHFQSPQFWHASLEEGLQAAREEDRTLLVQLGRLACGGSRALVEKTVSKEEIREVLDAGFVCVAEDLDRLRDDTRALVARAGLAADARTPFCIYLAPDGRVLHTSSGGRPPAVFLRDLIEAAARRKA